MAITLASRARTSRSTAVAAAARDWWQLHRAAEAKEHRAMVAGLRQVERSTRGPGLTLPEMMVASGCVR